MIGREIVTRTPGESEVLVIVFVLSRFLYHDLPDVFPTE